LSQFHVEFIEFSPKRKVRRKKYRFFSGTRENKNKLKTFTVGCVAS